MAKSFIMPTVFISEEANRSLFKQAIIHFLNGTNDINKTEYDIKLACTYREIKIDAKSFCQNIPLSAKATDPTLDPQIIEILRHLKLPIAKKNYTDVGSLYDLLIRHETEETEYLIHLIDSSRPTLPLIDYLRWPMLSSIALLGLCYLKPQYFWSNLDWIIDVIPSLYQWLYHYFVQLNHLPLLGMSAQIGLLAYYLRYDTFENGWDPSAKKIRALMFRAWALTLNFGAHWISYAAAGTLPLLPALIFVTSSFVDMIPSFTSYWTEPPIEKKDTYKTPHDKAFDVRRQYTLERKRLILLYQSLIAIMVSALILTVAALPSNVFLTMAYMVSMWFAMLVKDYLITSIKHQSAHAQRLAILGIYTSKEFTSEKLIQTAKNEFTLYAEEKLKTCSGDKLTKCNQEMNDLLAAEPFDLDIAKERFGYFMADYDKISPSKQNHSTPIKRPSNAMNESGYYVIPSSSSKQNR
ncbi:MAG TPA: hypothetical protein VHD33_04490 [Legionellaceae bacterium]|nr:hypothetical protein [Legionellaceae bacterium]